MALNRKPIGDAGFNENAINTNRSVEHLSELQGREGSMRYRQMSRGDGYVGMILRVHKNPIRSASWGIAIPDDATDQERLAIDVLNEAIFGDTGSKFDVLLGKVLSMMEYGFCVFEKYWSVYEYEGNKYIIPVLDQRVQTSIQDIWPQDKKIRQVTIDKGIVEIPFEDLVFFILNQQGEDMRGEAMLRNAYSSWKEKNIYKEWLGIGIQRSTSGVPSMKVPKGTRPDSDDYRAAEQLLKSITFHENAYMIFQEGWEFLITESKFNSEQVQKAIDGNNTEMCISVLSQFMLLGQTGGGGSFALSRDQSDFFLDGLQYIIDLICGVMNCEIVKPFLINNFGTALDPKRILVKGTNLNKKAGKELAEVLAILKSSGFVKPTVDDEIQLRKNLEMSELTEEEIEQRKETINQDHALTMTAEEKTAALERGKNLKFSEPKRKERKEYIDKNTKEMLDFMKANLMLIKDKLIADVEATLNRGVVEIQGLKNIEVSTSKYLKGLERKLAGIAVESYARARKQAKSNNVKLSEDVNPSDITDKILKQFVLNQAQSITDQQAAGLLNRAILTASNGPLKGYSVSQTISNVSRAIDDYIDSSGNVVSGSLVVVGTSNFGEMQFYNEIKDQIWGYEFVNDDPQSEICKWYQGKTFSVDSPELSQATPPLHPNCESYMQPIYKSEEKPEILNVTAPASVMKGKTIF